jgi:PucR family transcriptional regulator, purine catabolism regulatory protein
MAITIRELTELPPLRTWVHAGAAGVDREVSWAHVCELPDPTEWISGGELIMTTGLGVPATAAEQRAYVERLAAAGVAGLAISERLHPPLAPELSAAADALAFPVLITGYEIPFIALERTVADANRGESRRLLVRTLRLYEALRLAALEGIAGRELVERLAATAGCRAFVVDPGRGQTLLPGEAMPPAALLEELAAALAARATPAPAILRLRSGAVRALALPVPARRPASLLVVLGEGETPDTAVLQHVATIAALELEKLAAERERERRFGTELFAQLVDGRVAADAAAGELARLGLDGPAILTASAPDEGALEHRELHHRLAEHAVAHLLLPRGDALLALLPADGRSLEIFRDELDPSARTGVSTAVAGSDRVPDGVREARWALESARSSTQSVAIYGEDASPLLPGTLGEASLLAERVLGSLRRYDEEHGTALLESLRVFLRLNRSWQRAAAALSVHKQTLVYRMRRVEELTGRRLDSTEHVAELWIALRADEATGRALLGR